MKKTIFILFILVTFNIECQDFNMSYLTKDISYVQTYGLEDQSTIEFVKKLTDNGYFVIVSFNYFKLNAILNKKWQLGDYQEPWCDEIVKPLLYNKNIIGTSNNNTAHFVSYHLKDLDTAQFNKLRFNWPEFFLSEKREIVDIKDSTVARSVFEDLMKGFKLSPIDSLFTYRSMFAINSDIVPELRAIGITQKIVFINSDYDCRNLPSCLYENEYKDNTYLFIAGKGSKNIRNSSLNFKNKIKNSGKMNSFQLVKYEYLPVSIHLSQRKKMLKKDLLGFQFIYIEKLNNCMW